MPVSLPTWFHNPGDGDLTTNVVPLPYPELLKVHGMKYNAVAGASRRAVSETEHGGYNKKVPESNEITMSKSKLMLLRARLKQRVHHEMPASLIFLFKTGNLRHQELIALLIVMQRNNSREGGIRTNFTNLYLSSYFQPDQCSERLNLLWTFPWEIRLGSSNIFFPSTARSFPNKPLYTRWLISNNPCKWYHPDNFPLFLCCLTVKMSPVFLQSHIFVSSIF